MEIDMGEVDLVFGFCVYYTKNPEQRRAQQLVTYNFRGLMDFRKLKREIYEEDLLVNEPCIVAKNRGF
jgi:hypothetical protein